MSTAANAEEVQLAKAAIEDRLRELKDCKEAADAAYAGCAFEHQRALKEQARIHYALNEVNSHLLLVRGKLANETQKAVWSVIESAEESINLTAFDEVTALRREEDACRAFINNVGDILRETDSMVLVCEQQMLEAEADQIDALCALRDFDIELNLMPLLESEGEVSINKGSGVTAELRKRSGEIRMKAAGISEKLRNGGI